MSKFPEVFQELSGHNSRDRSECANVIGVISQPSVVSGRK